MKLEMSTECQALIYATLSKLMGKIEVCGASPELTDAVSLCSDLQQAVGNKYNPPNEEALNRIADELSS